MNTAEIVANHITNRGLKVSVKNFVAQLTLLSKQPNTKIMKSGDVIFVITINGDTALVYIVNGGGAVGYIKAVRQTLSLLKKFEVTYLNMRVSDQTSAKKIAESVGLKNVTFETFKDGAVDPYMMTAEI